MLVRQILISGLGRRIVRRRRTSLRRLDHSLSHALHVLSDDVASGAVAALSQGGAGHKSPHASSSRVAQRRAVGIQGLDHAELPEPGGCERCLEAVLVDRVELGPVAAARAPAVNAPARHLGRAVPRHVEDGGILAALGGARVRVQRGGVARRAREVELVGAVVHGPVGGNVGLPDDFAGGQVFGHVGLRAPSDDCVGGFPVGGVAQELHVALGCGDGDVVGCWEGGQECRARRIAAVVESDDHAGRDIGGGCEAVRGVVEESDDVGAFVGRLPSRVVLRGECKVVFELEVGLCPSQSPHYATVFTADFVDRVCVSCRQEEVAVFVLIN